MVTLSKIYTKTGDKGTTGLGDGTRRSKDDLRVAAYGDVDEANACIGLLITHLSTMPQMADELQAIQHDLFDLGGDLCVPEDTTTRSNPLRIKEAATHRLEGLIDAYNENLTPLKSFILPGGNQPASLAHMARTVVRRAERSVITLMQKETINPYALTYLNRLSDLLFVMARVLNQQNNSEVLWQPGKNQ